MPPSQVPQLRLGWRAVVSVAVCLTLVGCGGGRHRAAPTTVPGASEPATAPAATAAPSTTQPASTDPAVRGVLDALLHQWDALMTAAYRDPAGIVDHPDDPRRAPLRTAFTADSPFAADFDNLIRPFADNGWSDRPGPSEEGQQSEVLEITLTPDEDHLSFTWCGYNDGITVRVADGSVVSDDVLIVDGMGSAVRVDGRWAIYRLRLLREAQQPAATANRCPARAAEAAAGQ